jgi:hypothetical protein
VKILVSLILLMLSSTAFAATSEQFGMGGWIQRFQPEIDRANASGELCRIRGHCQSNCTLFLGLRNVCLERAPRCCFTPATTASATSTPSPPSAC